MVEEINDLPGLLDIIESEPAVVVDFSAPAWCVPCRRFAPHFEEASEQTAIKFVVVDVDKAPEAAALFHVQGVPRVMFFVNGLFDRDIQARAAIPLLRELGEM